MTKIIKNPNQRPLPPPGAARQEELSRRTDELEQLAEEMGENVGVVDPSAFEVDPALSARFNELEVSNRDSAYAYCWVFTGQLGRMVKMKTVEGWEVVSGDMEEAADLKQPDGTRRLGDVLLMRIRKDRKLLLDRKDRERRDAQQGAVTAQLEEMGAQAAKHGVIVHTGQSVSPDMLKRMEGRASARRAAVGAVDQMIRKGRVPGVPTPGRRGR
jgi:hypothetical protein